MSREYVELARLPEGHNGAITTISFSPCARYLAMAATDNRICIWEVASRKLLNKYHGSSYALCLAWVPGMDVEGHLLCGMLDGYIVHVTFTPRYIRARGLIVHTSPVEAIAVLGRRVASGSQREIRVWDWRADGRWVLHHELEEPPKSSQEEVSIAHLHWITAERFIRLLVVYVDHGVRIFDARTWKCLQDRQYDKPIANADVSIDGKRLAIANPLSGFGIYTLHSGDLVRAFGHEVGHKRATPVKFIEFGKAIVGGSTVGEVNVWDIETGRKVQTITHTDHRLILSLDAQYDRTERRYLIATAPCEELPYTVFLWMKKELNVSSLSDAGARASVTFQLIVTFCITAVAVFIGWSFLAFDSHAPGVSKPESLDLIIIQT